MERCVGLKKAAELLGLSKLTVSKLIKNGELVASQLKNKFIIKPSDIEKFLETHQVHKGE